MKSALLLLCHRIPYPPNKGDKIRTYHLLRYLVEHYRVYLGAFVDDPDDWQYTSFVESMCESCCFVGLNPKLATIKSATGLITGEALTIPYYKNAKLSQWIRKQVGEHDIEKAMAVSSPMAQFLSDSSLGLTTKVIDLVDIDSEKWLQYAAMKSWPMSWVYRREADKLFMYEKRISNEFDTSFFVSSVEATLFVEKVPASKHCISFYNNGVDSLFFSPEHTFVSPYDENVPVLVFTGAMDYWPNIDAVNWFVNEIFPLIRERYPLMQFYIVGGKPSDTVLNLQHRPGVVVTGRVDDVRPYLHYAAAAIAPMRVARGVQNKVLEAMAMQKPVVVTEKGLEGINAEIGCELMTAELPEDYLFCIDLIMQNSCSGMGALARRRVLNDFNWNNTLPVIRRFLENDAEFIS